MLEYVGVLVSNIPVELGNLGFQHIPWHTFGQPDTARSSRVRQWKTWDLSQQHGDRGMVQMDANGMNFFSAQMIHLKS